MEKAIHNAYTDYSVIDMTPVDRGSPISDFYYITELDMLLVISSNPYLVDLRNGNFFNAVRIAERSRLTIKV